MGECIIGAKENANIATESLNGLMREDFQNIVLMLASKKRTGRERKMPNLIHITHEKHADLIYEYGLAPMTKTPKSGNRLYAVERPLLPWACDHIMKRHKVEFDKLVVITIPTSKAITWTKYNRGVWYTKSRITISLPVPVREYLSIYPGLTLQSPEFWDTVL